FYDITQKRVIIISILLDTTALTSRYTLSLHDALPISTELCAFLAAQFPKFWLSEAFEFIDAIPRTSAGKFKKTALRERFRNYSLDRKSTRLNSSHRTISYAVFCLKKIKKYN